MNFKFNNLDANVSTVVCRELNFGQDRFNEHLCPYELHVNKIELIKVYGEDYERWNRELKEDDAVCNDEEPVELKNLGYPSLIDMIENHPVALGKVALRFLGHDMLIRLLFNSLDMRYAVTSLDSVDVKDDLIIFSGKGVDLLNRLKTDPH